MERKPQHLIIIEELKTLNALFVARLVALQFIWRKNKRLIKVSRRKHFLEKTIRKVCFDSISSKT